MTDLWSGFEYDAQDTGYTWLLGEFGYGGGGSSDAAMLAQLAAIQQQLVQLNTTLAQVNTSILQQSCNQTYDGLAPSTARTNLLWQEYQTLLGWNAGTGQYTNAPLTDTGDINAWIADASGAQTGANPGPSTLTTLTTMQTYLNTGGSGADSSITACIKAIASKSDGSGLPAPGSMDDRTYYSTIIQPILNYYYALQLENMTMYVEMNNYLAWQAAGSPTSTDPTGAAKAVCGSVTSKPPAALAPPAPAPSYPAAPQSQSPTALCELSYNFTVTANQQIRYQWAQAGDPYSTAGALTQNGANILWVTDLGAFTNANGGTCATPLPSWPTCGRTAGAWNANATMANSYAGYPTWNTATAAQWWTLTQPQLVTVTDPSGVVINSTQTPWGSGTLATWMNGRGFANVGNWIIYTGQSASNVNVSYFGSAEYPAEADANVVCFAATGYPFNNVYAQPFCPGQGNFTNLGYVNKYGGNSCNYSLNANYAWPACYLNATDFGGFFNFKYGYNGQYEGHNVWLTSPGFRQETASPSMYHWPVIDLTTVTCSTTEPGATKVNPAGVPSMCGSDLTAYLNQQVPPPTT